MVGVACDRSAETVTREPSLMPHFRSMPIRAVVLRMARNMLPSLAINAVLPLLIYLYLKRIYPDPSIVPIGAAALFPLLGNLISLARSRSLDPFGVAMLVGFGFTLAAIFVTGDPRIILVSRSLLTLGMGAVLSALAAAPKDHLLLLRPAVPRRKRSSARERLQWLLAHPVCKAGQPHNQPRLGLGAHR